MLESSEFEFNKKTEPIGAGVPTENGSKGSAVSSVSINSISQTSKKTIKNHILLKALIVKIYQGGLSAEEIGRGAQDFCCKMKCTPKSRVVLEYK